MYISHEVHQFIHSLALLFPAFLMLFTAKGFFRSLTAYCMGDRTSYDAGFVSLNPLAHINLPVFLLLTSIIAMPGLSAITFIIIIMLFPVMGQPWYAPPVNHRRFRWYYLGVVLVALSETIVCIVLAFLWLLFIRHMPTLYADVKLLIPFIQIGQYTIEYALWFAALNLIPLPPLGASDLWLLLGSDGEEFLRQIEPYSLLLLVTFIVIPGVNSLTLSFFNNFVFVMKSVLITLIG